MMQPTRNTKTVRSAKKKSICVAPGGRSKFDRQTVWEWIGNRDKTCESSFDGSHPHMRCRFHVQIAIYIHAMFSESQGHHHHELSNFTFTPRSWVPGCLTLTCGFSIRLITLSLTLRHPRRWDFIEKLRAGAVLMAGWRQGCNCTGHAYGNPSRSWKLEMRPSAIRIEL